MANLIYNQINLHDSGLQRLALKLSFRRDWLDEGKNIEVSQSEAEKGGSIPVSTWEATGDSQIRGRPPPPSHFFSLQIYRIHVNDLFQGETANTFFSELYFSSKKISIVKKWRQ